MSFFRSSLLTDLSILSPNTILENAHLKNITSLCFSYDSSFFISASVDKSIKVWETTTRICTTTFVDNYPIFTICYHPLYHFLFSGGEENRIQIWNISTRTLYNSIMTPENKCINSICVKYNMIAAACGNVLYIVGIDVSNDNINTLNTLELNHNDKQLNSVAFNEHGDLLLTGGDDCIITLYSVAPDSNNLHIEKLRCFDGHLSSITSLSFAPDSISFLSASLDKTVRLWHIETVSSATFLHTDELYAVTFSPDASSFLVGGKKERRYWDASKQGLLFDSEASCKSVAFSHDGGLLLTCANNNLQLTANAGSKSVLLSLFAQHHSNVKGAFSADSWRQLVDLISFSRRAVVPGDLTSLVNNLGNNFLHSSILRVDIITIRKCLELAPSLLNINAINLQGHTALRIALDAPEPNLSILAALFDAGVDVSIPDCDGNTCLHVAVKRDSIDLVNCLLLAGADVSIKNKWGVTASGYAKNMNILQVLLATKDKSSGKEEIKKLQNEIEILKLELKSANNKISKLELKSVEDQKE